MSPCLQHHQQVRQTVTSSCSIYTPYPHKHIIMFISLIDTIALESPKDFSINNVLYEEVDKLHVPVTSDCIHKIAPEDIQVSYVCNRATFNFIFVEDINNI